MTETVLVTGGTGFVGSTLAAALADDGHRPIALDPSPTTDRLDRFGVADDVEVVRGDVTDLATIARTIEEYDVNRIVHLAALLSADVRTDEYAATRVNAVGANVVLEAARLFAEPVERVVLASSETVYASGSAYDPPVAEDALLRPESTYASAKRHVECLADAYRSEHGVSAVAIRPTGVFGPFRDGFTAFADLFEKPAIGEPTTVRNGATAVSWLYVDDAADAFRRAALAADPSYGVYNIRGEVATVRRAAELVEAETGVPIDVLDDADEDWSAQRLSIERARTDLGYRIGHDLPTMIEAYAEAVRCE